MKPREETHERCAVQASRSFVANREKRNASAVSVVFDDIL
jgi:hypothetical protein